MRLPRSRILWPGAPRRCWSSGLPTKSSRGRSGAGFAINFRTLTGRAVTSPRKRFNRCTEPRYYEGLYHYDLGLVRIDGGSLEFAGTRCSFSIGSSEARRVWLASGPRHWTPRKIVCVEYQLDGGKTGFVSLQSLERWFWPGTSAAAQKLFAALRQWSKNGELPGTPASPPPQIAGAVLPRVGFGAVWKSMQLSCMISLCVSWFIVQIPSLNQEGILAPFAAPLVTGALILFLFAPHLERSQVRHAQRSSVEPPVCPEAE